MESVVETTRVAACAITNNLAWCYIVNCRSNTIAPQSEIGLLKSMPRSGVNLSVTLWGSKMWGPIKSVERRSREGRGAERGEGKPPPQNLFRIIHCCKDFWCIFMTQNFQKVCILSYRWSLASPRSQPPASSDLGQRSNSKLPKQRLSLQSCKVYQT